MPLVKMSYRDSRLSFVEILRHLTISQTRCYPPHTLYNVICKSMVVNCQAVHLMLKYRVLVCNTLCDFPFWMVLISFFAEGWNIPIHSLQELLLWNPVAVCSEIRCGDLVFSPFIYELRSKPQNVPVKIVKLSLHTSQLFIVLRPFNHA